MTEPPKILDSPTLPVPRATPERLVSLLVTLVTRVERLEGISDRLAEHVERVERRFDAHELRVVAIHDKVSLAVILASQTPSRQWLLGAMAGVAASTVLLLGLATVVVRHWTSLLDVLK